MKLTKTQLKRIIKEELAATLGEAQRFPKSKGVIDTVKSFIPGTDASAKRDLFGRIGPSPPPHEPQGPWRLADLIPLTMSIRSDKFFAGYRMAGGQLVQDAFEADGDKAYEATKELTTGKFTPKGYANRLRIIAGQEPTFYGSD